MNRIAALNGPQTPPPGSAINPVTSYLAWGVLAVCLVGFAITAVAIGRERVKDRLSEQGLLLCLLSTVLIGTAGAIVGSVTS